MLSNLDDTALEEVARYFAALSVPMRLKILNALRDGERNVGDLTQITGCTQANVSKHLSVLSTSGLVGRSRRGTSVFYRIADPRVYQMCDIVCGEIGRRLTATEAWRKVFLEALRPPPRGKRARA